jgi:hypothetical protein
VKPPQAVLHERRTEADCVPILEIGANLQRLFGELLLRAVELPVVPQSMNTDLETFPVHEIQQRTLDLVRTLGDEIEGRVESVLLCEFNQPGNAAQALRAFHVMGQDQRELLAVGPAGPTWGHSGSGRLDRPDGGKCPSSPLGAPLAECYAQAPRQDRLQEIVDGC